MKGIDLVYFDGCPNIDAARANLRAAMREAGLEAHWREWDAASGGVPEELLGYGSPAVLVDGVSVGGEPRGGEPALSCAAVGAPGPEQILAALRA